LILAEEQQRQAKDTGAGTFLGTLPAGGSLCLSQDLAEVRYVGRVV